MWDGLAMALIPVIDLLGGQVVRALRGERGTYRPVQSRLCPSAEPIAVAQALTRHCATDLLYVADLDALLGGPAQVPVLRALLSALPGLSLWVDAGFADREAGLALLQALGADAHRVSLVFGSESLRDAAALAALCPAGSAERQRFILSLDRRNGRPLDLAGCWDAPATWPDRVVVMTLERVGTGAGPDLDTVRAVRAMAPQAQVIGAGGIRNAADLAAGEAAGAAAWLVASALHDGGFASVAASPPVAAGP
jgi:uncharacterized protein related to proFAR isomerase